MIAIISVRGTPSRRSPIPPACPELMGFDPTTLHHLPDVPGQQRRPVQQYSKQGKPLQRFDSIKRAAEVVGINSSTLIGALTGKQQSAGGYQWKYL